MRRLQWLACAMLAPSLFAASVNPTALRCEYRTNPEGIDVTAPRLGWILEPASPKLRALRQTAYRVLAASASEALAAGTGDLWDSGRVSSDRSVHVVYAGKPLTSGARVFWKVQVWDQDGKPSEWSAPAHWSMGLLAESDWKAKWIGRDEATLYKNPASPYHALAKSNWISHPNGSAGARFFRLRFQGGAAGTHPICILGADSGFEAWLNGTRLGRGNTTRMPDVYDIATLLRPGENVLAVRATGARNKPAALIGALRVGNNVIPTGSNWKTADTAPDSWQQPAFDDSRWTEAKPLGPYGMAPWGEVGFIEERALPARMLRKEFDAPKRVRRATAYVSGLGLFELYVNGAKVGEDVLSPGLTDYGKRVQYVTYDVTARLASGRNAVGLLLGNGRYWAPRAIAPIASVNYGYPKAILQLHIEYQDGSTATLATDESWRLTTGGPIRANNEYDGEEYDARMEQRGWTRPGFDDSRWEPARVVAPPAGALVAQMAEPIRVTETLRAVSVKRLRPGVYVFDMGQNMVGWCRLKVSGPKGTQVSLRHAETLRPDGSLYLDNLRSARATDSYTLRGGGPETWEPRFTYHGFRYVEVQGFPGTPKVDALEGRVVHDAMARTADFETSNALLNRIHRNILWGVRGNYRSIPTDCPQRDERQGWLGDRSMVSRSESYLFDVAAFYSKWMTDLADSQNAAGAIPDVAPAYWKLYNDNLTWPSTFIFVPGMLYEQYGDLRVIERNYPAMKRWFTHIGGYVKDGLMPRDTYGDWCVPPERPDLIHSQDPARRTDGTLLGTAYYYKLLRLMARYARLLDKPADAADFDSRAAETRAAFQNKFFNPATGLYSNGTQTSGIVPLAFDMVPPENRAPVFAGLIGRIETESKGHIGTGLVGAQWLMRTLSDNGRADVAYTIANQKTYPGWGYMLEKGATTIWELWNGDTADPAMNSGNHVMQIGDLGVWLYEYLAGIRSDPQHPGFQHAFVKPYPAGDLAFVKASHRSPYGTLSTEWKRDAASFTLDVAVPPNTSATVYVPARAAASVTESGAPAEKSAGVRFLRMENGAAVFQVSSGSYSFRAAR